MSGVSLPERVLDRLLGPLVPLSFGAPGLRLRRRGFDELARLDGRHVVITGANSGIGLAATLAIADLGARVTMVCRDRGRAEAARDGLSAVPGRAGRLAIELCDVSRLGDVARLAARLRDPIDVVIHNAGVLPLERSDAAAGLELTWATHVAGPHLLMRLLRPRLSAASRCVLVSSGGMYLAPLVAPATVPEPYDGVRAYALTKRAQVVLAELWSEHDPNGPRVVSMHPGWVDTAAVRTSLPRFHALTRPLLRDAAGGADTLAWLAACPHEALHPGGLYFDRVRRATHLAPWRRDRPELRAALWQWCNAITAPYL
ncbi:MAG: SDR family NAD(P)-dependent oxidoreductase [Myxococcales bacterium]|nr:SDR family NAD(P)-dependent oxidoreductase [Myxococcales bacterium]